MKSNIEIILNIEGLDTISPVGASLFYGVNMVPVATLDLSPDHLKLLCNFEKYRRQPATLKINTTRGCIYFKGLVDGLSFFQAPGNVSARLVIKHDFQMLMETNSRLPGFHPSTPDIFRRIETLNTNPEGSFNAIELSAILAVPMDSDIVKFFVEIAKAAVTVQKQMSLTGSGGQDILAVTELAKIYSDAKYKTVLALLDFIDTSATAGMIVNANSPGVVDMVIKQLQETSGNLLDDLMLKLNDYGAALVIGNDFAYTIPESGFLKMDRGNLPEVGAESKTINVIYPAQYDSFSFNDVGYKDIKTCYVVSDENMTMLNTKLTADLGVYTDPDEQIKGGVLMTKLPKFVALAVDYSVLNNNTKMQKRIAEGTSNCESAISHADIEKQQQEILIKEKKDLNEIRKKFTDNWAQMRYLQAKYADRTGSIRSMFNPKWAPGACGSLYTRLPGTYLDFFVDSIEHRFTTSLPSGGEAVTNISFKCGRMGTSNTSSGLEKIEIYNYNYDSSLNFCNKFVDDIMSL